MECDDGDFTKQLMREKLRHERANFDLPYDPHSWVPAERWNGPPWVRGRTGFHHDYSTMPRHAGGRGDGPSAKKFRGEWPDYPHSLASQTATSTSFRMNWHPHPRPEHLHYFHGYPYTATPHGAAASTSSSSVSSSQLMLAPSLLLSSSSAAMGARSAPVSGATKDGSGSKNSVAQGILDGLKEEALKNSLGEFFIQHKDQEWFRLKYHPLEFQKRKEERRQMVLSRKQVFEKLMKLNLVGRVNLEVNHVKEITKILDAAVILMEGGTEQDLKILEQEDSSLCQQFQDHKAKTASNAKRLPAKFTEPLKLERNPRKATAIVSNNGDNISDSGSISDSDEESGAPPRGASSTTMAGVKNEEEVQATPDVVDKGNKEEEEGEEESCEQRPKPLHRTVSLFLRNLPVDITKAEIENVCKTYPGFLRVALQDPQPDNKFLRRAWVTFEPWVNVKDVCWNMGNLKVGDYELKPTVNCELKQRVRTVSGLVCHKAIAKQDIKHIVKVIQNLDSLHGVWDSDIDESGVARKNGKGDGLSGGIGNSKVDPSERKEIFGFVSKNPLLKNITDFLVDEGSYEEEALLDKSGSCWDDFDDKPKPAHAEVFIEKDADLLKALDKMILYLRIVHSLDYYVAADYQDEDDMPHKCGIIHVRASKPTHKVTQSDVNEWMDSFEVKISEFTRGKFWLPDEEVAKLGKDEETEVDKFIQANTQELSKDKWMCPLSGKKFKGPDFVKKHIKTKHADKVELVKTEVEYFNNYVRDGRRPCPVESPAPAMPTNHRSPPSQSQPGQATNSHSPSQAPRFVHHYPSVRRPNVIYRPPYGEIRNIAEAYRPRDFLPRRGRFPRPFPLRMVDPSSQI